MWMNELKNDENMNTSEKRTNKLGRVQNANESPFRFVPQTVLRLESALESEKNEKGKKNTYRRQEVDLVEALTKGPNGGGIGPFEIMIVSWVERLRYVTSSMLLDLIHGGYISKGWREKITKDKMRTAINRLARYNLVEMTRFVSVDENGVPLSSSKSAGRVYTLGSLGSTMLREMGKATSHYHAFDIYQDGNAVKRYLAANQWLIYWLINFPEQVGENYRTNGVVYQYGSDLQGARFYATVTCNECTMIAEPVRRVEEFEDKANKGWQRGKLNRLLELFNNTDKLYSGQEEIMFPDRPVIVYVCEDDDHIREVWKMISDIAAANPQQEIWLTSDQRIFNYNMIGQRFVKMENDTFKAIDLEERVGVEEVLKE